MNPGHHRLRWSLRLIRTPLSPPELRASESRAGGNRTHSGRLKVCCAAFTPRPHEVGRAYAFQSPSACHCFFSFFLFGDSVVALGIELSATRLSAEYGQPALDYLIKVGNPGVEPRPSCSQNRRASICTSARNILSVRTAGFEPAVSWPPTRRDNQASLRSDCQQPVWESNPTCSA